MKLLLILTLSLMFSCSTSQKTSNESPAGESDAKPVSPYTVKPCYCMKIFQPVCADGINYSNSCEAECHGHTKWSDGHCPK